MDGASQIDSVSKKSLTTVRVTSNSTTEVDEAILESRHESELRIRPSEMPDAGMGLFTSSKLSFKPGEFVIEYKGDIITKEQAIEIENERAARNLRGDALLWFQINSTWQVKNDTDQRYKSSYINHASKKGANLEAKLYPNPRTGVRNTTILVCTKSIPVETELCYDYGDKRKGVAEANHFLQTK